MTPQMMLKIFVFYVHKKYSTTEIAEHFGISAKTVGRALKETCRLSKNACRMIQKQKRLNVRDSGLKGAEKKIGI